MAEGPFRDKPSARRKLRFMNNWDANFVLCPSITPLLEGQLPIGHGNRFPCLGYHPLSFPKRCHLHMALGLPEPVPNIDLDFH